MDLVVRARHARNRQADIPDSPHVLAGIVEVEHPFRNFDVALACRLEAQEFGREVEKQGDVLRQFVLTTVAVEVRLFQVSQLMLQLLACEQAMTFRAPREDWALRAPRSARLHGRRNRRPRR
jgi:hypothetical protein